MYNQYFVRNNSEQCELGKTDLLRDNMSSFMLPKWSAKLSVQSNQWTAISALCLENDRWPTVIIHTVPAHATDQLIII